jgi:hypothetical protein
MAGAEEPAPLLGSAVESHTRVGICRREARRAWTRHRGSSAPPGKAVEGAPPGRAARSLRQATPGAPSARGRPARTGRPRRRAPLRQRQGRLRRWGAPPAGEAVELCQGGSRRAPSRRGRGHRGSGKEQPAKGDRIQRWLLGEDRQRLPCGALCACARTKERMGKRENDGKNR